MATTGAIDSSIQFDGFSNLSKFKTNVSLALFETPDGTNEVLLTSKMLRGIAREWFVDTYKNRIISKNLGSMTEFWAAIEKRFPQDPEPDPVETALEDQQILCQTAQSTVEELYTKYLATVQVLEAAEPKAVVRAMINFNFLACLRGDIRARVIQIMKAEKKEFNLSQIYDHARIVQQSLPVQQEPAQARTHSRGPPHQPASRCQHKRHHVYCRQCHPIQCEPCKAAKLPFYHVKDDGNCSIKKALMTFGVENSQLNKPNTDAHKDDLPTSGNKPDNLAYPLALAARNAPTTSSNLWCVDSGASEHYSPTADNISQLQPHSIPIYSAQGASVMSTHRGILKAASDLSIPVTVVPELQGRLLSINKLCDMGYRCLFDANGVTIYHSRKPAIVGPRQSNGMYYVRLPLSQPQNPTSPEPATAPSSATASLQTWHRRFGHLHPTAVIRVSKLVDGMNIGCGFFLSGVVPCNQSLVFALVLSRFSKCPRHRQRRRPHPLHRQRLSCSTSSISGAAGRRFPRLPRG